MALLALLVGMVVVPPGRPADAAQGEKVVCNSSGCTFFSGWYRVNNNGGGYVCNQYAVEVDVPFGGSTYDKVVKIYDKGWRKGTTTVTYFDNVDQRAFIGRYAATYRYYQSTPISFPSNNNAAVGYSLPSLLTHRNDFAVSHRGYLDEFGNYYMRVGGGGQPYADCNSSLFNVASGNDVSVPYAGYTYGDST